MTEENEQYVTAKKISTIRLAFAAFIKGLGDSGMNEQFSTKVIFALTASAINKAEGMDVLMDEWASVILRETRNENDIRRDPAESG